jgi:MFS family permease
VETVESPAPLVHRPAILRRNVACLIADVAVWSFAAAFVDLSGVMPSLVTHLTRAPVLIGLLGSIQTGCWLLPQLFFARFVAARERKLPVVVLTTAISRLGWVVLLATLLAFDPVSPGATLAATYLSIGVFFLFDGLSVLGWYDLIARVVPPTLRGRVLGFMAFGSGAAGVVGGLVVQRILGNPAWPFPSDYRLMLVIALIFFALGLFPLSRIREPPGEPSRTPEPFGAYLRRLPGLVRDRPDFRRLVGVQLLVGSAGLALPFYAPYGTLGLGLGEASVGVFVVGVTLGVMVGGLAWGWIGDRGRKDRAIQGLAACALLAPLVALGLRGLVPYLAPSVAALVLAGAFFFVGTSSRSGWVAVSNYLLEIAGPAERPVLIGLLNTLGGILAVVPPLGGLLAGWLGYEATFVAAAVPAAAALVLSFRLKVARAGAA